MFKKCSEISQLFKKLIRINIYYLVLRDVDGVGKFFIIWPIFIEASPHLILDYCCNVISFDQQEYPTHQLHQEEHEDQAAVLSQHNRELSRT